MEIEEGTVIYGTTKLSDLIPRFLDTVLSLDDQNEFSNDLLSRLQYYKESGYIEEYWESDAAGYDIGYLFAFLNCLCPSNMYFGSLEGDGADFGFWRYEEE